MPDDYTDIKEFRIRSNRGQWAFKHFYNNDPGQAVFEAREGGRSLRIIPEAQVRRLMAGETVDLGFPDMRKATGDWWIRTKRRRDEATARLAHDLRTSTHPILSPLVEQLGEVFLGGLTGEMAEHWAKAGPKRLNETMTMLMGEWACPVATTEWIFNRGSLNNMNLNWRRAFAKVFGVNVKVNAPNKTLAAAFDPVRQELLARLDALAEERA
ncbi:MAG: hypothetical protein KJ077_11015 [Anaerolineae bacterium]|nr:hypothetical protein [Anaerolineae bacterium]